MHSGAEVDKPNTLADAQPRLMIMRSVAISLCNLCSLNVDPPNKQKTNKQNWKTHLQSANNATLQNEKFADGSVCPTAPHGDHGSLKSMKGMLGQNRVFTFIFRIACLYLKGRGTKREGETEIDSPSSGFWKVPKGSISQSRDDWKSVGKNFFKVSYTGAES